MKVICLRTLLFAAASQTKKIKIAVLAFFNEKNFE